MGLVRSAGIYPGVSNLMAAHMVSIARREYDASWRLTTRPEVASSGNGHAGHAEVSRPTLDHGNI